MTRTEFKHIANTEGFDTAMSKLSENVDTLHDEDLLIQFVKDKLDSVDYPLAAHVLNAIVESKGDSRWYDYDFTCGTLDKPVCINTVEEVLTFDYFDNDNKYSLAEICNNAADKPHLSPELKDE